MNFDFIHNREAENILPVKLDLKEQYHLDLMNVHQSWTGRVDAMFANGFFREAIQLIINAMALFEKGYFDCAFYSLRQSLEIVTTVVYFVDNEESRALQMKKWKNEEAFPMHNQMVNELINRKNVFADIKAKMASYFKEIESTKKKLNKYVHKQGYDKFYISRSHPLNKNKEEWMIRSLSDFENYLVQCIGAIAVFRLAIDPFPVLLSDEQIYNRTGQFMTEGYSADFISKYIGLENINDYKKTELYKETYEYFISTEEMLPSVVNVVKHEFVDRTKIDEILSQCHLLSNRDIIVVGLISYSEKIAKVYCNGGFLWYFTNIETIRTKQSWGSADFKVFADEPSKFNVKYDEAFLSHLKIDEEDFYVEHNEEFLPEEMYSLYNIAISAASHNNELNFN